jgi:hydroxymethylglutaryl-CoA lyase
MEKTRNTPSRIKIREVGPRDGFQSWPDFVPTDRKLAVIAAMIEAGIHEMETTSFVSPKAIPQMRDAADVMREVRRQGCRHAALVPNLKGAGLALAAGADELVVVISASEAHNQANVRRSIGDSLADLKDILAAAKEQGTPVAGAVAVAFGCPYQGDVPDRDLLRVVEAYAAGGAASIILADTTGMATPPRIQERVRLFMDRFPAMPFSLHLHNNRGTAMTNLYAALLAGATTFDTALGGIGGCPNVPQAAGNLATEDVVYMLSDMAIETGIDLEKIIAAACLLERILGRSLPGQVMKSGPREPERAAKACGLPS